MEIKNISHGQHIDFETVTVEFSSMCSVTTVFKYVKNLAAEQKVSIVIPQALEQKNEDLREWSFLMRTEEPKHKTVIKYIGNNLVMYAKKVSGGSWFLVNHPPQIPHPSKDGPQKRPRNEESTNFAEDPSKKVMKTTHDPSASGTMAPQPEEKENDPASLAPPKPTGIPMPNFKPVPCYTKPSPLLTSSGSFWPDVARSPSTKANQNSENC